MTIRVCLAGAAGWAGSALARRIAQSDTISLVAAVSRTHAGRILGEVLAEPRLTCAVYATAEQALAHPCDVLVEYTKPEVAKANSLAALRREAHVVIGTSGLTDTDYAEIAAAADKHHCGVLAVANFALTAVLLQKFAKVAAKYIPQWEIIDHAQGDTKDAPNGTARELVRLPGYTISAEIIFGMPDQKLSIRHDSGTSPQSYVDGALVAIRKVGSLAGLHRGLDTVLD